MSRPAELLRRRVVPSAVIALSQIDSPSRLLARVRRRRVELFVALDDPCSAVASIDLARRLAGRPVQLVLRPVVRRGIPDDPAVTDKRRYALLDARRRASRLGLELARTEPVEPGETAQLAAQVADAPAGLVLAALEHVWLGAQRPPVARPRPRALRRNERRMRRRGAYDTPAVVVAGRWCFAHDRAAQVVARVEALGWA